MMTAKHRLAQTLLLLAGFWSLGGALPLVAQTVAPKVEITADNFVVDEANSEATFSGNVVVTQPDLELLARIVVVHYGPGGPTDMRDLEASGAVKITTPGQVATGDRGTYNPTAKIFHLTGKVTVTNASGTVQSGELLVDLNKGTSKFTATPGGGRVTGVFTPGE